MAEPVTIDLTHSESSSDNELSSEDVISETSSSGGEEEEVEETDAEIYEGWSSEPSCDESEEESDHATSILPSILPSIRSTQPPIDLTSPFHSQQNSPLLTALPPELRQEIIFLTYRIAPKEDGTLIIYSELAFVCRQLRAECKFAKRIWLPEAGPLVVTPNVQFPDVDAIERHFVRVGKRRGVGWEGFRDVVVRGFQGMVG